MAKLHWSIGVLTLVLFVLTGQYMQRFLGELAGMADGQRMLYRSAHIYLLFSGFSNLLFANLAVAQGGRWRRIAHRVAGAVLLMAPVLLLSGFFLDSSDGSLDRRFVPPALFGTFAVALWTAWEGSLRLFRQRERG